MSSEFNFWQNWYPISPLEDLKCDCPISFTLLGKPLVIWKNPTTSTFQVFLDQCPHRLAPLSEGRIDQKTGNLMCSYHGWQFNGEGICTCIPQAENPDLISKNKDNFAVTTFPTREVNDLLWVWADATTPELAQKTPLPVSPQIDASQGFVWSSMVRDLAYDWQTLVENVADPSHVPFAHHGVQGNRDNAKPIPIEIVKSSMELIEAKSKGNFQSKITFQPPCRLEYAIKFGSEGKKLGLITYCVPIVPGKCRIVAQFTRNFATKLKLPRWWEHIKTRNLVLDGDMILLHQQEIFLHRQQKLSQVSWKNLYKLPTSADRLVIEFRKWFDTYCSGKLPWEEVGIIDQQPLQINHNREQMLDRYHQHTQHCHSCRTTLNSIQKIQKILFAYFVLTLSITALLPDPYRLKLGIPIIVTGLLGLAGYSWLKLWLEPQFYFVDYIHAEK